TLQHLCLSRSLFLDTSTVDCSGYRLRPLCFRKTKRKLVPKSYPFTEDIDVVPSDAGHRVYDGNSTFSPKKQCLDGPIRISSPPIDVSFYVVRNITNISDAVVPNTYIGMPIAMLDQCHALPDTVSNSSNYSRGRRSRSRHNPPVTSGTSSATSIQPERTLSNTSNCSQGRRRRSKHNPLTSAQPEYILFNSSNRLLGRRSRAKQNCPVTGGTSSEQPPLSGPPVEYKYLGNFTHTCQHCGALFWFEERLKYTPTGSLPLYNRCCRAGRVALHGEPPQFLQLYIYDTDNEVDNRLSYYGGDNSELRRDIVEGLINLLDSHNALVQLFRTAREKIEENHVPNFKVRLYNVVGVKEYELHTGDMLGAIVYEPGPETAMNYDMILETRSGYPQRVSKLHPSYMSLQFPLLFIYGEDGNEYLSRIYDAISRGDNDGSDCSSKFILPQSFTGGPRYMYSHYLDALAICRVHRNPSYFITFTCNVNWPEISEYMAQFPLLTTTDRADIVDRVFEMKIHQFINYLRDNQPFGKVVAVLYTVEFQKRGIPHCHTLLWIDESVRVHQNEHIDTYVSAELPSQHIDPQGHRIVSELMMHGPCGLANLSATCRTAHSRFKISLDLTDTSVCAIKKNTQLADLLKETCLIVWDESPMNDLRCFETLDRTLRDILNQPAHLFGGKTVMLGGDFRQTLPVKRVASRNETIRSSITNSYIWHHFKIYYLTENMRMNNKSLSEIDKHRTTTVAQWLLDVGNGQIGITDDSDPDNTSWVDIPDEYCIPDDDNAVPNLINFIYDADTLCYSSAQKLQEKAIVCPKNDTADIINDKILSLLTTTTRTYLSHDDAIPHTHDGGEIELLYPKEYLNSLSFPGLPPHNLTLKVGSPVMLLRNMNIVGGLCNGTRLIVSQLLPKVIEARIITGTRINHKVPMSSTSYLDAIAVSKGKMVAVEPQVSNIASLKPAWVSKYVHTRQPIRFCCILLDRQGTPIQANMDSKDTEYFDQLL
nr:DNA helicase [Tanacetum cinerariifolium]